MRDIISIHFHEVKRETSKTGQGQMLEAKVEGKDKSLRPRPRPRPKTKFWPRDQLGFEDLTSLKLPLMHASQIFSYLSFSDFSETVIVVFA